MVKGAHRAPSRRGETEMTTEYMVLLHVPSDDDERAWDAGNADVRADLAEQHRRFASQCAARGHRITAGAELQGAGTGTVVRLGTHAEPLVTDGPFTETVEQLGGFYLVQTDDLDDLVRLVVGVMSPHDVTEIRPTVDNSQPDARDDATLEGALGAS